jgi:hypothetical protein
MAAPPIRLTFRFSEENPMQKLHFVWLAAASWACGDRQTDLGLHVVELQREDGSSIRVACESEDDIMVERACVIGSDGTYYAQGGDDAKVVPAEPPYGAYAEYQDTFVLNPDGLVTEGEDAPIKGFATLAIADGDDPPSRVPVSAEITREGGLLVLVEDAVPTGTRINIVLEYGNLFLSWPEGSPCPDGSLGCLGYGFRFFVGEAPELAP